jgi:tRNA modification GTPase
VFSAHDTIVAIATPFGRGGLGVVRLSGTGAAAISRRILDHPTALHPRHATLVRVKNAEGRVVDSAIATYFSSPHSYTGEDVVELSVHGSPVLLKEVLRAAMREGARLAGPGEFTLRAFLNGRMDLVRAEAVADLVDAGTTAQARLAFDQLDGTLSGAISELDDELFALIARLEASLDFPDEGFQFVSAEDAAESIRHVAAGLDRLLAESSRGRLIREGRQIGIVGRPNVGKSCVFNNLTGSDRSIVTSVPGTTRDLISATAEFEGILISLVDTAGIRATEDEVEREGVSRARRLLEVAAVTLLVLDRAAPLEGIDLELLATVSPSSCLIVVNKCDLAPSWRVEDLSWDGRRVCVSMRTGEGVAELRQELGAVLGLSDLPREAPIVANVRHVELLRSARAALAGALDGLAAAAGSWSEEFLLADLQGAKAAFEEVTGARTTDDMLDHIFSRFCVGK